MSVSRKIYISGPISADVPGADYEERKERFHRAEVNLRSLGYDPVNPLWVNACEDLRCGGYLDETERGRFRHTWHCYLRYDLKALVDCEMIAMLPGWFLSKGARLEFAMAEGLEMDILNLTEDGELEDL